MMNTRKASMSFNRGDVSALYEVHNDSSAVPSVELDTFVDAVLLPFAGAIVADFPSGSSLKKLPSQDAQALRCSWLIYCYHERPRAAAVIHHGTSYANKSVLQAIIGTAGVEEKILTYNYACLAANNNFFLDNLKPPPQREMSPEFSGILKVQYKDLDHLKEEFIASAMGMASSGWLWLVTDGQNRLTVLPTFGAGTLLVRSGHELPQSEESSVINSSPTASLPHKAFSPSLGVFPSPHDGPPPSSPVSGISSTPPSLNSHSPSRTFHTSIARPAIKNPSVTSFNAQNALDLAAIRKRALTIGAKVYPLMCLSIHEHAWISGGLGVWGKEEYVRRFFSVVNWSKVSDTFQKFHASPLSTRTVR
ncbi:hypothetical protein EW145_g86 [Phellinidium pouzarii]|uniref:Manganese/iron superoxide dismutase C-terminal domain-containing protein n=1 Tax=Phellinidium pouzarii TaxID=167371 RepID=A0A4S4LKE4_9AGAM|nr:hypothetical protein EW145_g86 [Phellinidium pouzarii]